ncbi:MAG: hypothetical protein Q7T48_18930 [Cellvibrio sp.]|uniref:hypothetical protein n=1 Tax=Cellvibrio sp. TaxID=1965322 RepID=UPI002717A948|nr:hypothetical protein [Cellvibrio sp.]
MEIIAAIVEAIIAIISAIIEAIVGIFVAGAEVLSIWEAAALLLALLIEMILWVVLIFIELIIALFKWRRPKKVMKPVIWRPSKLKEKATDENN